MTGLTEQVTALRADVAMLRGQFVKSLRVGPIVEAHPTKGYRVKLADGPNGPMLSPWLPHPESGKSSVPLKVGDVVGVGSPSGDMRQGFIARAGYSGPRPSPNENLEANVFEDAGVRVALADGALIIEAGGTRTTISGEGLHVEGGPIRNNSVNVGDQHRHQDIMPGTERSGVPES